MIFNDLIQFFVRYHRQWERKGSDRPAMTKSQFIEAIAGSGGDGETAAIVWDKLQDWGLPAGFSPHPDDSFEKVYSIAEEELDEDIILDILNMLKLPIPDQKTTFSFGIIDTPRRVAEFISLARQS